MAPIATGAERGVLPGLPVRVGHPVLAEAFTPVARPHPAIDAWLNELRGRITDGCNLESHGGAGHAHTSVSRNTRKRRGHRTVLAINR